MADDSAFGIWHLAFDMSLSKRRLGLDDQYRARAAEAHDGRQAAVLATPGSSARHEGDWASSRSCTTITSGIRTRRIIRIAASRSSRRAAAELGDTRDLSHADYSGVRESLEGRSRVTRCRGS